jgi:hypothetical protein
VGRMWMAHTKAIADFDAARQEHQGLGVGAISNDAPRSAVLEAKMITALGNQRHYGGWHSSSLWVPEVC